LLADGVWTQDGNLARFRPAPPLDTLTVQKLLQDVIFRIDRQFVRLGFKEDSPPRYAKQTMENAPTGGDDWAGCEGQEVSILHVGCDGEASATGIVKMSEAALSAQFKYMEPARLVFEVGTYARWLAALFEGWGHEVVVANARKLAVISQNNRKSDEADAELLARPGRSDVKLLSPIEQRSQTAQRGLVLVRSRATLVRSRTMPINSVRGQVKAAGGRMPSCDADHLHELVESVPPALRADLTPLVTLVGHLTKEIDKFDKKLERQGTQWRPELGA